VRLVRRAAWFVLGTVLLGIAAFPGVRVPIIGDDLHAYFETYAVAGGSAGEALAFGWGQGMKAGHFNPVGQAIGALYHFGAFAFSSAVGSSPQLYDVAVGGLLLWLTVLAATGALWWGLKQAVGPATLNMSSFPRTFALLAAVTAVSLQQHPWTNDPVTTFGMAGWGSAAIGFLVLGLALRATIPGRTARSDFVAVGLAGVVAVLYYEELVGMIAGAAAAFLLAGLRARRRRDGAGVRRAGLLAACGVALPAVVFVAGRYFAIPAGDSNYTGTTVSIGPDGLGTWWAAMVGALPGGGWPYLVQQLGGAFAVTTAGLVLGLAMVAGLAVLVVGWGRAPRWSGGVTWSAALLVAGVVVGWALTTATQAFTPKYIDEIRVPGQVYLYYAVGVVCVSMLIAFVVIVFERRLRAAAPVLLLLVGAFTMVQLPLNWQLSAVSEQAFSVNRLLVKAASNERVPPEARCAALLDFARHPWPDYYREAVVTNAVVDFQMVFDTPLCPDPAINAQVDELLP